MIGIERIVELAIERLEMKLEHDSFAGPGGRSYSDEDVQRINEEIAELARLPETAARANKVFESTADAMLGFQISAYEGEDRLLTLDPLYESVEDAIAHEGAAAESTRHTLADLGDPASQRNLRLRVEAVTAVVWL